MKPVHRCILVFFAGSPENRLEARVPAGGAKFGEEWSSRFLEESRGLFGGKPSGLGVDDEKRNVLD